MSKKTLAKKIIKHSGKLSLFLLSILLEVGATTVNAFFNPTYSYERINYKKLWNQLEPETTSTKIKELKPRTISTTLQRLQKQGLVVRENRNWSLTKDGEKFIKSFFDLRLKYGKHKLPEKDGISRIVIFDIPEKERDKRDWIRGELLYHQYEPLQKSVWIGYCPLLPQLIENIDHMGLSKYIHIFSVKDEGTINS